MPLLPVIIDPNVRTVGEHDTDHETLHADNNVIAIKGDIPVGSGPFTWNKIAVSGVNGRVLTEDSSQTTGVAWAAIPAAPTQAIAPFSRTGTLSVVAGAARFKFPFAATIINVTAAVNTAPTGADIILDVNLNGVTIFTTQANRPRILAGTFQETVDAVPDVTAAANDQYLTVDIDQVGSGVAGADLTVFVRYSTP